MGFSFDRHASTIPFCVSRSPAAEPSPCKYVTTLRATSVTSCVVRAEYNTASTGDMEQQNLTVAENTYKNYLDFAGSWMGAVIAMSVAHRAVERRRLSKEFCEHLPEKPQRQHQCSQKIEKNKWCSQQQKRCKRPTFCIRTLQWHTGPFDAACRFHLHCRSPTSSRGCAVTATRHRQ